MFLFVFQKKKLVKKNKVSYKKLDHHSFTLSVSASENQYLCKFINY